MSDSPIFFQAILDQLFAFSFLEWFATITSIIYIILAIRNTVWCFLFAALASISWGYISFVTYHLIFDAFLQLFYLIMAGVGAYTWSAKVAGKERAITKDPYSRHIKYIIITLVASLLMVPLLKATALFIAMPYIDSITTGFSILGTILLIYRKIESWIYLLICDLIYAFYIYPKQGAYLFALLMIVYSIMAVIGYRSWSKQFSYLDVV